MEGGCDVAFVLEMKLAGHSAPVSCVAVSRGYSIIVSGSTDGTCTIWDLNEGTFVATLDVATATPDNQHQPGDDKNNNDQEKQEKQDEDGDEDYEEEEEEQKREAVVCVDTHGVTGEVATCTATRVTVWSVNGVLEAAAVVAEQQPRPGRVLCCAFDSEWVPGRGRVLLTGHHDGTVAVWDLDPVDFADRAVRLCVRHVLSAGTGTAGITALHVPYHDKSHFYAGNALGIVTQWTEQHKK